MDATSTHKHYDTLASAISDVLCIMEKNQDVKKARHYDISVGDLYMELSFYSGLTVGITGYTFFQRVNENYPASEGLFRYEITSIKSLPRNVKNAPVIKMRRGPLELRDQLLRIPTKDYMQTTFPHLVPSEHIKFADVNKQEAVADSINKIRDIIVDMCSNIESLNRKDRASTLAYIQECDKKIIDMFETIDNALLTTTAAVSAGQFCCLTPHSKPDEINQFLELHAISTGRLPYPLDEWMEWSVTSIDRLPYTKEYSNAEIFAIYNKMNEAHEAGKHNIARVLLLELPLSTEYLQELKLKIGIRALVSSGQNLINPIKRFGHAWFFSDWYMVDEKSSKKDEEKFYESVCTVPVPNLRVFSRFEQNLLLRKCMREVYRLQLPMSIAKAQQQKEKIGIQALAKSGANLSDAVRAYGYEWLNE